MFLISADTNPQGLVSNALQSPAAGDHELCVSMCRCCSAEPRKRAVSVPFCNPKHNCLYLFFTYQKNKFIHRKGLPSTNGTPAIISSSRTPPLPTSSARRQRRELCNSMIPAQPVKCNWHICHSQRGSSLPHSKGDKPFGSERFFSPSP